MPRLLLPEPVVAAAPNALPQRRVTCKSLSPFLPPESCKLMTNLPRLQNLDLYRRADFALESFSARSHTPFPAKRRPINTAMASLAEQNLTDRLRE